MKIEINETKHSSRNEILTLKKSKLWQTGVQIEL
jgi:hypothetical protein